MVDKERGEFFEEQEENIEHKVTLIPQGDEEGKRIDAFLAEELGLTRSYVQKLIRLGNVEISGIRRTLKPALKVTAEMAIHIVVPPAETLEIEPEPVKFGIIYEDPYIIVVNKPAGLVVHPAPGNWHGTLVHGLLYKYRDMRKFDEEVRPGIVHRLDSGTSGLLVVARTPKILQNLQNQFRSRSVEKKYLALSCGKLRKAAGFIEEPIGRSQRNRLMMTVTDTGRPALTEYRILWTHQKYSFIECTLHTGRTHQIRVHLKHRGCPIVGDGLYGTKQSLQRTPGRMFLHAWKLAFDHPINGSRMSFRACLPQELSLFLKNILSTGQGQ